MPQLDVGHRRTCQDREGKVLQTWRRNNQSKEREDGEEGRRTPCVHTVQPVFCNNPSARHQRLHPGCWLIYTTPSTGTLVQTPFLYLRIPQ
jgi:hypothetical protein